MVVITKTILINFYEGDPLAKEPILNWYHFTILSDWKNYHSIKETFNAVDSIGNDRYVFNIGGNKYRIVAMIHINNMIKLIVKTFKHE